jgi:hypothetical protein
LQQISEGLGRPIFHLAAMVAVKAQPTGLKRLHLPLHGRPLFTAPVLESVEAADLLHI